MPPFTNGLLADLIAAGGSVAASDPAMFESGALHGWIGEEAVVCEHDTPTEAAAYLAGHAAGQQAFVRWLGLA